MFNLHNKRAPRWALGYTWEYIHSNDSTDGRRRKENGCVKLYENPKKPNPHLLAHDNGSGCVFFHFSSENFLPFLSLKSALTDSAEKKKNLFPYDFGTLHSWISTDFASFPLIFFSSSLHWLKRGFFFLFSFFFFVLPELCSRWDLSSLTRDGTCALCSGSVES